MQKHDESSQPFNKLHNDENLDEHDTRVFIGGTRPIHRSTLYRGVKSGRYPKPIKVGPKSNRWRRCELQECLDRWLAEREGAL